MKKAKEDFLVLQNANSDQNPGMHKNSKTQNKHNFYFSSINTDFSSCSSDLTGGSDC